MSMKAGVRIVKRAERELRQVDKHAGKQLISAARSKAETSRDAVATITEWVTELRRKKSVEVVGARPFKRLFTEAA